MAKDLEAPNQNTINIVPSPEQWEMYKYLLPNRCPHCGGEITHVPIGDDGKGNQRFKPQCAKCGSSKLPQIILGGGAAGGGKTWLGSAWIISSCMTFPNIRAIVARKTIKSLKDSTFNTIKMIMRDWQLEEGKNFKINNIEGTVTFWNGSQILLRELDLVPSDAQFERLGSVEATIGFVDEVSEISQKAVEVLFSRLRWQTHYFGYPRLLLTTNPCTTWVRSTFVQDDDGNPITNLPDHLAYVPFSVYSNPNKEFVRVYEASLQKLSDPALIARLLHGNWDYTDTNDAACYWKFSGDKHLVDHLRENVYDPLQPLILSFDFNVAPYMSCLACQINYAEKKLYVLEEILGKPQDKENNTPKLAEKIRRKYLSEGHLGGLIITGDPSGLQRNTVTADGSNNYSILMDILDSPTLRPKKKLLTKQPSQITRLEFINSIFDGYQDWAVQIDMRCRRFTEDLIYQKKDMLGGKEKHKITDPKLGVKYEKYGHLSDCFDMVCCLFLSEPWKKFNSRIASGITTFSGTPIYGSFDY